MRGRQASLPEEEQAEIEKQRQRAWKSDRHKGHNAEGGGGEA